MPELTLIIPTFNESLNIEALLKLVQAALVGVDHEILVVDDNSPDGTADIARRYAAGHPEVRVIVRTTDRGLSAAVIHGMRLAHGKYVGVMDADLSHDERILPKLLEQARHGHELAVGSRRVPGGGAENWPWYRRLTSDLATRLAKAVLDVRISDPMSGYFVAHRALFERAVPLLNGQGYKILLELYCCGRPERVSEVPFVFRDRKQGYSKLSSAVMRQYLSMVWSLRKRRLYHSAKAQ
jgi:dolichol-phosphate mannosyltransferase